MGEIIYAGNSLRKDIIISECGYDTRKPGSAYGPAVRDIYLMHFIIEGKGVFKLGENSYELEKGNGFLVCPGMLTYYAADCMEPWSYLWIGFRGPMAEKYLEESGTGKACPVFAYKYPGLIKECLAVLMRSKELGNGREEYLYGIFHLLLSQVIEESHKDRTNEEDAGKGQKYVRLITDFLKVNYEKKISLKDISRFAGLESKYICSLFRKHLDISPHKYLMSVRMDRACELLRETSLAVSEVARSVGYDDPLLFSRMFRKKRGMSPTDYRNG